MIKIVPERRPLPGNSKYEKGTLRFSFLFAFLCRNFLNCEFLTVTKRRILSGKIKEEKSQ